MIWKNSYKKHSEIDALVTLELRIAQHQKWQEIYIILQKCTLNEKRIISFRIFQIISYETPWILKIINDCH